MKATGQRLLPAAEGLRNTASPNLAQGCPAEKMLVTHCLEQRPGAAVKMPKAFLALSTGSLPPVQATEIYFFFLSFF